MALPKLFQRIIWHNNTTPAINEDNLNAMSKAIDDIDDRVIDLGADVLEKVPELEDLAEQLEEGIQNPPYIGSNGNWYIWNTTTQQYVDSGVDASISVNIADVTMLAEGATPYVTNTGTSTDPIFHLFIPRGATGATGAKGDKGDTGEQGPQGIQGIQGEQGEIGPTPNITMSATADDTSSATPSVHVSKSGTAEAPSFALEFSGLKGTKGDTGNTGATGATGNGISSITKTGTQGLVDTYTITMTDGTTATFTVTNGRDGQGSGDMLKSTYDSNNAVANAGGIADYVSSAISGKANSADLAAVATSGSYNDLSDKPTIPSTSNCYQSTDAAETTLADGDYVPFYDASASAKRKTLWSNIKSVLKTYFDGLYKGVSAHDAWSDVTNKPFASIGSGLTVSGNVLKASQYDITLNHTGTASATVARQQNLAATGASGVNTEVAIDGTRYLESSTKTTSSGVDTFSFTNANITTTAVYDFYADVYGVAPSEVSVSTGSMSVKFKSTDSVTKCRVYIK